MLQILYYGVALAGAVLVVGALGTAAFDWVLEALSAPSTGLRIAMMVSLCGIATHFWDWMDGGASDTRRRTGLRARLKTLFLWIGWLALWCLRALAALALVTLATKIVAPLIVEVLGWIGGLIMMAVLLFWAWLLFGPKECDHHCCCRRCRR